MAKRVQKKKAKEKKKKKKTTTTKKRTSKKRRGRAAARKPDPPPSPLALRGPWKVKKVRLEKHTPTIGVEENRSKFTIQDGNLLVKTANVAWNGSSSNPIQLNETPANDILRKQNIVLKATVDLGGKPFELGLGSDDSGVTLKIQLVSQEEMQTEPGGSGSAGR